MSDRSSSSSSVVDGRRAAADGRRRWKTTLTTLSAIAAGPGRSFLRQRAAMTQLENVVFARLEEIRNDGYRRTELCTRHITCDHCCWALSPYCQSCGKKFANVKKDLPVYPLYLPKFTEENQLLHLEVCLLCSEACSEDMCKKPVQQISQQLARERNNKKKKSVVFYDPNRISTLSVACHMFFLAVSLYTIQWTHSLGFMPPDAYRFFTTWNVIGVAVYFAVACLTDASARYFFWARDWLRHASSYIFTWVFVIAIGTAVIFWSLFYYDREMVFPRAFIFPATLNHLQHTIPACMMAFELVTVRFIKNHPLWELATVMLIPMIYVSMTYVLRTYGGVSFPYPFMQRYTDRDLLSFGVCATAAASVVHWMLNNGRRVTGHYTMS